MVVFLQDGRTDDPVHLSVALEVMKERLGLARSDVFGLLASRWRELLGDDLAHSCELVSLRDGVMVIAVGDPAVADGLRWMTGDLVAASNEICGGSFVTDVRISITRA